MFDLYSHSKIFRDQECLLLGSDGDLIDRQSLKAMLGSRVMCRLFQTASASIKEIIVMKEEDILPALDKPRAIYALQQRLDPSNRNTDALQEQLISLRAKGVVKFDIKTGKWRKA